MFSDFGRSTAPSDFLWIICACLSILNNKNLKHFIKGAAILGVTGEWFMRDLAFKAGGVFIAREET